MGAVEQNPGWASGLPEALVGLVDGSAVVAVPSPQVPAPGCLAVVVELLAAWVLAAG